MGDYELEFLDEFLDDLFERMLWVEEKAINPSITDTLTNEIEAAILSRTSCAESFEPVRSRKSRFYNFYRIYVNSYVVYYTVIERDGKKIMVVHNLRHELVRGPHKFGRQSN